MIDPHDGQTNVPRPPPSPRLGLAAGAFATLLTLAALPAVAALPYGLLALDIGLAWGFVSLVRWAALRREAVPWSLLAVSSVPYVGLAHLVRRLFQELGLPLPLPLGHTILFEVLWLLVPLLTLAKAARLGPSPGRRPLMLAGVVGAALASALLLATAWAAPRPSPGAWGVLALTIALVGLALAIQALAGHRLGPVGQRLAAPTALALSFSQLLDGVVTYLAVVDPLGWAGGGFREQVALSAFVLEHTGPGYPLLKWVLAMVLGFVTDFGRHAAGAADGARAYGLFLVLVYVGLQPGLFSAGQLL